jgi:response regulator RpfG family c-di-GMP phosphodiesterase
VNTESAPSNVVEVPELRRLLVLDDEEIVLVALRETLIRAGYEVVATGDAMEAIEFLRGAPFAVIITDQQMPRMTGLEFLAHAKELQPDATRILITAVLNLSTVIEAINKGEIYRFIIKPWLREEFLGAIESAVQRHRLVAGNAHLRATAHSMMERVGALERELEEQRLLVADQNQQMESLHVALEQNLHRSVELCVRTMETFYPTLGIQGRRVFELCRAMAMAGELPAEQQRALGIAAWLHDVGLIGVPRRIIRRWELAPESLPDVDRAVFEQHPLMGEELSTFLGKADDIQSAIRTHHERFDGKGYPDGLAGDAIPWLGRLLAVAVAFADSNQDQPTLVEIIRERSGTAFDPEAVVLFLRAIPRAVIPRKQREVSLADLRPGMVLAQGIYTSNGVLLVPGDHELSETYISKLRNHNSISPICQSLLVYC